MKTHQPGHFGKSKRWAEAAAFLLVCVLVCAGQAHAQFGPIPRRTTPVPGRPTPPPQSPMPEGGLPLGPTDVTVEATPIGVRVRWAAMSGSISGYRIYRERLIAAGNWGEATTITVPAAAVDYADIPPFAGQYRYRVHWYRLGLNSRWSATATITVNNRPAPAPLAPGSVTVTDAGQRRAVVSWVDSSLNETGFEVERQPAFQAGRRLIGANVTSIVDDCGPGVFSYRVRALSGAGPSGFSVWAQARVEDTIPGVPSSVTALDMGNERDVRITWTDNSNNETGFRVERERRTSDGGWGESMILTTGPNEATLVDAAGGGTYRYRITSVNVAGPSSPSDWVGVIVVSGWTELIRSPDTRVVYVSSSQGSDSNDGLTEATAKRSLAAGYGLLRDRYPDWLLLKRGDVWTGQSFAGTCAWNKSGRSSVERVVLGAYGIGPRPVVHPTGAVGGWVVGAYGGSSPLRFVAIVGIKFLNTTWNGDVPANGNVSPSGIDWCRTGTDFLVEDCYVEGFANNVLVQGFPSPGLQGFSLRRCILANPLRTDAGNTNIYVDRSNTFLVEQNVFYQTRDNEVLRGNKLSHNVYFSESNSLGAGNVVRENILYNGRSNLTVRMSADVHNNLSVRGGLAITLGHDADPVPRPFSGTLSYNVVTESRDHWNGQGLGWGIDLRNVQMLTAERNLVFRSTDGHIHVGLNMSDTAGNVTFQNNVMYDWTDRANVNNVSSLISFRNPAGPIVIRGCELVQPIENWILRVLTGGRIDRATYEANRYAAVVATPFTVSGSANYSLSEWRSRFDGQGQLTAPTYPDAGRTLGRYNEEVLGGVNSTEAVVIAAAGQARATWNTALTARAMNAWLRAGFALPSP